MRFSRTNIVRAFGTVALALSALSCADRTIVSPDAAKLSAGSAAFDAIPGGGELTWLAPLGTGSAVPATFDALAVTKVDICVWTAGACSGAPVAQFTITPAPGAGTLTANAAVGQYEATWSLMSTSFITRKTYRIRVLRGTTDLGGILVDVVRGRWALTRTDGTLAPLAAATELPIHFHVAIPRLVLNEIESNGGVPDDWVEFYNAGTTTIDLSGWVFRDNDDTHFFAIPAGTTIAPGALVVIDGNSSLPGRFSFGLGSTDAARIWTPWGTLVDSYNWTAHAATTYGRCPNGTGPIITTTSSTKGLPNDCSTPGASNLKINEVESSGGTPGDWVELYNTGTTTINLAGFTLKDATASNSYTIASGSIAAGGYFVLDEATFGFGLGASDAVRLFDKGGSLLDSYSWSAHAETTYGRCANGTGIFVGTLASTKGFANACPPPTEAWPGTDDVAIVDGLNVFGTNLSGLIYETFTSGDPDVLWGVRNGPSTIFRLVFNGSIWTPDTNNDWGAGKTIFYTNGAGGPDSEDLTFTTGSLAGMYVSTERDNNNSGVSHPAILRYDVTAPGTTLTATNEWDLTADLPVVPPNSGLEAITWISDDFLTAHHFFDPAAGHAYNPADYTDHGGGLFFVGLEGNGSIYVYALNHTTNGFTRITTIATGFPLGVMSLRFDAELGQLWSTCDNTCGGLSDIYVINGLGQFQMTHVFARPSTMPNINNEGFGFAPQSRCVGGFKQAFWADDDADAGHSIRRASIPCSAFSIPLP